MKKDIVGVLPMTANGSNQSANCYFGIGTIKTFGCDRGHGRQEGERGRVSWSARLPHAGAAADPSRQLYIFNRGQWKQEVPNRRLPCGGKTS
jgi:hypothetical protein